MNLSQEAIDLLEAMLAERLEMMQMLDPQRGFNYYCDSCGDADCDDDNCRGRDWERENPHDRYGSYDDHDRYMWLDPHRGFNYYCDSCGDADCNDDNCRGRDWERENPQDRYGSYDDHDRYMWLDSSYDTYDDHELLYGGVSDDWETYYDSVYN